MDFISRIRAETNRLMYGTLFVNSGMQSEGATDLFQEPPSTREMLLKYGEIQDAFIDLQIAYDGLKGKFLFIPKVREGFAKKATALEIQADVLHAHASDAGDMGVDRMASNLSKDIARYRISKKAQPVVLPSRSYGCSA
jgi:hypothetical protein